MQSRPVSAGRTDIEREESKPRGLTTHFQQESKQIIRDGPGTTAVSDVLITTENLFVVLLSDPPPSPRGHQGDSSNAEVFILQLAMILDLKLNAWHVGACPCFQQTFSSTTSKPAAANDEKCKVQQFVWISIDQIKERSRVLCRSKFVQHQKQPFVDWREKKTTVLLLPPRWGRWPHLPSVCFPRRVRGVY